MSYDEFDGKLRRRDPELLSLFPGLHGKEKGKTVDDLFDEFEAVKPVKDFWGNVYKKNNGSGNDRHSTESSQLEQRRGPAEGDLTI